MNEGRKIDKIEFRFDIKPDRLEQFNLHDSFEDFMRYLKNKGYKFFAKNHEDDNNNEFYAEERQEPYRTYYGTFHVHSIDMLSEIKKYVRKTILKTI